GGLVFAGEAAACSCAPIKRGEMLRQADAAFAGRLVAVIPRGRDRAVFRYRVRRVFKRGPGVRRGRVVSVRSARSSAACGLPTKTGRPYGLALSRAGRGWTAGSCSLLRKCAS
ncbi:MAG TPA: hypothetical protein VFC52_02035, partial [Solirubrobacterales bacterium]|nr:hypothetical protein [Solirubrobacterales bacterium]